MSTLTGCCVCQYARIKLHEETGGDFSLQKKSRRKKTKIFELKRGLICYFFVILFVFSGNCAIAYTTLFKVNFTKTTFFKNFINGIGLFKNL